MQKQIKPVALIANQIQEDGRVFPAAQILKQESELVFDPMIVAGYCISLYDCFLNHIPESRQLKFEEQFMKYFKDMFELKDNYINIERINYDELE